MPSTREALKRAIWKPRTVAWLAAVVLVLGVAIGISLFSPAPPAQPQPAPASQPAPTSVPTSVPTTEKEEEEGVAEGAIWKIGVPVVVVGLILVITPVAVVAVMVRRRRRVTGVKLAAVATAAGAKIYAPLSRLGWARLLALVVFGGMVLTIYFRFEKEVVWGWWQGWIKEGWFFFGSILLVWGVLSAVFPKASIPVHLGVWILLMLLSTQPVQKAWAAWREAAAAETAKRSAASQAPRWKVIFLAARGNDQKTFLLQQFELAAETIAGQYPGPRGKGFLRGAMVKPGILEGEWGEPGGWGRFSLTVNKNGDNLIGRWWIPDSDNPDYRKGGKMQIIKQ